MTCPDESNSSLWTIKQANKQNTCVNVLISDRKRKPMILYKKKKQKQENKNVLIINKMREDCDFYY